jgi:SAM-dependent methyltransferase
MTAFRRHAMQPQLKHDERARRGFVKAFRGHLSSAVMPGTYQVYAARVEPAFRRAQGRPPATEHEVREHMTRDPYYQFWSAMQRRSQEMIWETVIEPTERQLPELIARSRQLAGAKQSPGARAGSLRLDPTLVVPRYHTAVDIHLQPGGYHTDFTNDDVAAGAVYDLGINIYSNDALGPENGALGELLVGFYRQQFPKEQPTRVLDMGCAIGNSTLQWARAFPKAEMHAIDVGAPVLRYAHARAQALGVPVHFSQQNAEGTDFDAGSFDLVISHIMLHETSKSALPNIFRECRRLLRPGGLMLHLEIPRGKTPVEKFMFNWEAYNNNETFGRYMTDLDLKGIAVKAGFPADQSRLEDYAPPAMDDSQKNYGEEFLWKILVARA